MMTMTLRIVSLYALLLLLISLGAHASATATPAVLTSVFLSIDSNNRTTSPAFWSPERWGVAFNDLSNMNIRNIILANAVHGVVARYPTKLPGLQYTGVDAVGTVLQLAEQHNMTVFLGLVLNQHWFGGGQRNATFLRQYLTSMVTVSSELHDLYGRSRALTGFYNTAEVWDGYSPTMDDIELLAHSYLEPLGQHVHSLSAHYVYSNAPFYGNISTPSHVTSWWSSLLPLVPSLDLLMPQDGVGVQHVTGPEQTMEYLRPLSKVAAQYNIDFWTDVEIFVKFPLPRKVAPFSRVREQLELEAGVTSGMTCWEWSSYMDPHNGKPSAGQLYRDYVQYLNKTSRLE